MTQTLSDLYLPTEFDGPLHLLDVEEILNQNHVHVVLDQNLEGLGQLLLDLLLVPERHNKKESASTSKSGLISHFVVT